MSKIAEYKHRNKKRLAERAKKQWPRTLWKAVINPSNIQNTLLAIFTGLLVIVGYLTDQTWRDTLEVNRLEQRAWIAPRLPEITSRLERGQTLEYDTVYENIGKQPALNIVHIGVQGFFPVKLDSRKTAFWEGGPPIPPNHTCPKPFPGSIIIQANERAAFFGQQIRDPAYLFTDGAGITDDFLQRKITFYVQGCIIYYTLGKPHFSAYCAYLYPSNEAPERWKFRFCPNGNYTDEYQPYSAPNVLQQTIINSPK